MNSTSWHLQLGEVIKRTVLHERYGGRGQGGIGPSAKTPNVLIFTDPAIGQTHGYDDRWDGPMLLYVGEGQRGNQELTQGNKAILEHKKVDRALRVFRGVGGTVQYLGEFVVADDPPFVWDRAPETGGGPLRDVVRFRLRPARLALHAPPPLKRGYRPANESPSTEPSDPFARDPNEVDRGLAAHAKTQNALNHFLGRRRIQVWSPGHGDPDFDIAWERKCVMWVGEVKSVTPTNTTKQLRLGLGQVLDYQDSLLLRYPKVQTALVSSAVGATDAGRRLLFLRGRPYRRRHPQTP